MQFLSSQIFTNLLLATLPLVLGFYFHFYNKNYKVGLALLILSGLIVRVYMASVDPFVQDWDERFHALVAKNMMQHPFKPMLRVHPLIAYDYKAWCCNHIWLHKQPLFLWQMALSMKMFGISAFAIRIPAIIMGTLSIYHIYEIARSWIKNIDVAFIAAALFSLSFYQLELSAGNYMLDQNDVCFAFYMTASFWAFVRYLESDRHMRWAILIGVFVGCAVLTKWLTGILIFGGWVLYELLQRPLKWDLNRWRPILVAITTCMVVFIPWQIYILHEFPMESRYVYDYNAQHITQALEGHKGGIFFHLNKLTNLYNYFLLPFIPLGIYSILTDKRIELRLTGSFFTMVLVVYFFFSAIVRTKMMSFTFPINAIIWICIAAGLIFLYKKLSKNVSPTFLAIALLAITIWSLRPNIIAGTRLPDNLKRNAKIWNAAVYKSLSSRNELDDRVILNCPNYEDVEVMFYQDLKAYGWYPDSVALDSLMTIGYKFAAFTDHHDQHLPSYILNNKDIIIIDTLLH